MAKQIITVGPDGSLFGLDHKKKGLKLKTLGKADTRRATMVEFSEEEQAWYIRWENEALQRGKSLWCEDTFKESGVYYEDYKGYHKPCPLFSDLYTPVYFEDYEDAVSAEVAVIQSLQTAGSYAA